MVDRTESKRLIFYRVTRLYFYINLFSFNSSVLPRKCNENCKIFWCFLCWFISCALYSKTVL